MIYTSEFLTVQFFRTFLIDSACMAYISSSSRHVTATVALGPESRGVDHPDRIGGYMDIRERC